MGTLLEFGLDNAFVALMLAPVAAVFGRLGRRPALAHILWLLVLLRLVAPPLLGAVSVPIPVLRVSPTVDTPLPWWPVEWTFEGVGDYLSSVFHGPGRLIIAGTWIGGITLWLALTAWQLGRFRHFLEAAQPASSELQDRACELAARLGLPRAPGVWLVPSTVAPMVWAAGGSPRLILPVRLWDGLDRGQRDALLVHELAHLRRRDHWVRLLEAVVTALYWWHPAVWWARRELHESEERCCDAWVVGTLPGVARSYASALLATVDFLSGVPSPLPVGASGLGRGGHFQHLRRRLTLIMGGTQPRALTRSALLAVLLLGIVTMPLSVIRARTTSPEIAAQKNGCGRGGRCRQNSK